MGDDKDDGEEVGDHHDSVVAEDQNVHQEALQDLHHNAAAAVGLGDNQAEEVRAACHSMDRDEILPPEEEADSTTRVVPLEEVGDTKVNMAKSRPLPNRSPHFHCHILVVGLHRRRKSEKEASRVDMVVHDMMRHLHDCQNCHVPPTPGNPKEEVDLRQYVFFEIAPGCMDLEDEVNTHGKDRKLHCSRPVESMELHPNYLLLPNWRNLENGLELSVDVFLVW